MNFKTFKVFEGLFIDFMSFEKNVVSSVYAVHKHSLLNLFKPCVVLFDFIAIKIFLGQ